MPDSHERFRRRRRIDSYHKIWFLLFMHQHSEQRLISREYIRQLIFPGAPMLDKEIGELLQAGLLTAAAELLRLDNAHEVRHELDALTLAFEVPTRRQELLRLLSRNPAVPVGPHSVASPGSGK